MLVPKVSPQEGAAKWNTRMKIALSDMERGAARVSTAPGQLAAQKQQKWLQNVQQAAAKWRDAVASVPLEEWRAAYIQKGLPRISGGVDLGQAKLQRVNEALYSHIAAGEDLVRKMPDLTLQDSIQRAARFIEHMAKFRR
jgi:hypothetical protein